MRIEDLDGPRVKPEATQSTLDVLAWLGLDYDGETLTQSDHLPVYRQAMEHLAARNVIYACSLTRREIEAAASAPHDDDPALPVVTRFRPAPEDAPERFRFRDAGENYRLVVPPGSVRFHDELRGEQALDPARTAGDFPVWTKRGTPSYQLSVVVDDIRQGVTDVVRGDDLLDSAARQVLLYRHFDAAPPRWWHLPLVVGEDGRRLAKRHGDTRLTHYRAAGVPPERIIGLLAWWCGIGLAPEPMAAPEFREAFRVDALPASAVTFSARDDAWLLESN